MSGIRSIIAGQALKAALRDERGQMLPIVVAAMFVLLGIGALVSDIGLSWLTRRHGQSAVDPAAVAAARYIRPSVNNAMMFEAACFYARQNGFFPGAADNSGCTPDRDPGNAQLQVFYPPTGSLAGQFAGRQGFVQVVITQQHPNFFGRIFGRTTTTVSTSAVAAHSAGDSNSSSLVALDPTTCSAGKISGGGTIRIDPVPGVSGGYVQVNSVCGNNPPGPAAGDNACGNGNGALKIDGGGTLIAPSTYVHGTCVASGTMVGPLHEAAVQIGDPLAELAPPRIEDQPPGYCNDRYSTPTGPASKGCKFTTAGVVSLNPGVYYGGWEIGNRVQLHLAPGIYYIAGGGIRLTAGGAIESVSADGTGPAPILIFSTDNPYASCPGGPEHECQQSLDFSADSTLRVRGLDSGPWKGLLIWQDGNGSNPSQPVTIGGQSTLNISGTIYAPKALVTLSGGSTGTGVAAVQIISWQWTVTGGALLTMPYDPNLLYHLDQKGLVH